VDFAAKTVTAQSSSGVEKYTYGKLVIATGARPIVPNVPGISNQNVFYLRNLSDGIALRRYLETNRPGTGIIIGGGFIGLEMAEAFKKLSIKSTILEKFESVAMAMSPEVRKLIADKLREQNVEIHTGVNIEQILQSGSRLTVRSDSGRHETDFILVSAGIAPNTVFLKGTDIRMTDRGAVIVDEKSQTNIPDVYSAGDCATVKNLITGRDVYMPLATTASKQGRVAGIQAAGVADETFKGIVGSQLVRVFGLEVGKTGFNAADAEREEIEAESASIIWKSKAGYYPTAANIFISLTVNSKTRELIGGEAAGTDGAALRVDIMATALAAGMKVEDIAYLDLGYAPPFSPVWDPVNAAAQKLIRRRPA
jgi:NADPH-dependent 2,4-dienoyl-CoA reductase/sulfur reductase-like enzyme